MRKFGKYLREVSVVIIGVTITLIATNWINNRGEKKDLQLYLDAVQLELEDNLRLLEYAQGYFEQTFRLREYIRYKRPQDLNIDSLKPYKYIVENYYFFTYKTSAFDMLKMSGAMRLIKDKELLLDIWNSYSYLENYKIEHNDYMDIKSDIMANVAMYEDSENDPAETVVALTKPKQKRLRVFYTTYGSIGDLKSSISQVRKTIERFR